MPDIVEIIKEQHKQVDDLLSQAEEDGSDTAALLQEVARMLLPHSEAEEDFVYPAIRDKAEETGDEVRDGVEEHRQIEEMLKNLLDGSPDDPGYDGTLAAIIGELRHHVQEEEEDLLPILADRLTDEERAEMGQRFVEATTGALPETPVTDGDGGHETRRELYEKAKDQHIPGRSRMSKEELAEAVSGD
ncbi:hemerythrin domain-containing protein [Actinoplanes sp. NPDC020271]|uniref:hemerythrin domain-containing protein n=1 Tax=Actinoplanes sp. NPDC020271 TaxID=3363896 RepID=UPI0037A35AC6